jgi:hypothetical protein
MSQNHSRAAPAINPTKKSSLFEVPFSHLRQTGDKYADWKWLSAVTGADRGWGAA